MEAAVRAIGHPARWKLLAVLAEGEALMLTELAQRLGRSPGNVSKQLGYLRRSGVVKVTRRLHHLAPRFSPSPAKEVDFGWFVARFGIKK
jgi:predicted transcriptional regulator